MDYQQRKLQIMAATINIARDFNRDLGGRWKRLGEFSGEEFYDLCLKPKFEDAMKGNVQLVIELDGASGYPSSFLDQSFGELARVFGKEQVRRTIRFNTQVFGWIVDYIEREIWDKI